MPTVPEHSNPPKNPQEPVTVTRRSVHFDRNAHARKVIRAVRQDQVDVLGRSARQDRYDGLVTWLIVRTFSSWKDAMRCSIALRRFRFNSTIGTSKTSRVIFVFKWRKMTV